MDEFILLDDVQYTRRDWRNRNQIKTPQGRMWLTIPVQVKGKREQLINETAIVQESWSDKHWEALCRNYAQAPCFEALREEICTLYRKCREDRLLSDVNHRFLVAICGMLGIATHISWSTDWPHGDDKVGRLVDLCEAVGGDVYVSGPSAQDYMDENQFNQRGIQVEYADYSGFPEYTQLFPPFVHEVSILDLLFNTGKDARHFLESCSL